MRTYAHIFCIRRSVPTCISDIFLNRDITWVSVVLSCIFMATYNIPFWWIDFGTPVRDLKLKSGRLHLFLSPGDSHKSMRCPEHPGVLSGICSLTHVYAHARVVTYYIQHVDT